MKKRKDLFRTVIIVFITMVISIFGTTIYYKYIYISNSDFSKLVKVYDEIEGNYYTDIDQEELLEGAVDGMVDALDDPFTDYMNPEEANAFHMALENEFVGVGIAIEESDDGVFITKVFEGSPASEAGLSAGDRIVSIDGEDMTNSTIQDVSSMSRGPKGTKVEFEVDRPGNEETINFTLIREHIELEDLQYSILDNNIGYIKIVDFTSTVFNQFDDAYYELKDKGITSLIIDVRNNGGGYLDQVLKIADLFVDDSKPIYQEKKNDDKVKKVYGDKEKEDMEVVMLVNGSSASASELLTASLNEISGSKIVGETTFGKGTAQTSVEFSDGSLIKYTYAQWLTPNGNWINEVGISPTNEEELSKIYSYNNVLVDETLSLDTVNEQIKNAQLILTELGYETRIDGYFDNKTAEAIKAFQKAEGINVSGELDSETATKLNEVFQLYLMDYHNDNQIMTAMEVLSDE